MPTPDEITGPPAATTGSTGRGGGQPILGSREDAAPVPDAGTLAVMIAEYEAADVARAAVEHHYAVSRAAAEHRYAVASQALAHALVATGSRVIGPWRYVGFTAAAGGGVVLKQLAVGGGSAEPVAGVGAHAAVCIDDDLLEGDPD